MKLNRKYLLSFFAVIVVCIAGYIFAYNYFNSTELTVNVKNISSYTIHSSNTTTRVSSGAASIVRVPKFSSVSITFRGTAGYETGKKDIKVGDTSASVTINPYFSKERLESIMRLEKDGVKDAILAYEPAINNLYSLGDYRAYHFGEWASALLIWKGEYGENSDSLRVILKKENDTWRVVGVPSILFYSKNNPEIPVDILRLVNNF